MISASTGDGGGRLIAAIENRIEILGREEIEVLG